MFGKYPQRFVDAGRKGTPVCVHGGAAVLTPKTPHYFWAFHLPSSAWSLMYSVRIYHIGLMFAPDCEHALFYLGAMWLR
jgi:hypothetical protein